MRFWAQEIELSYKKLSRKPEPPYLSKSYREQKGPADPLLLSKRSRKISILRHGVPLILIG